MFNLRRRHYYIHLGFLLFIDSGVRVASTSKLARALFLDFIVIVVIVYIFDSRDDGFVIGGLTNASKA